MRPGRSLSVFLSSARARHIPFVRAEDCCTEEMHLVIVVDRCQSTNEYDRGETVCVPTCGEIDAALCSALLPVIKTDARLLHCSFHQVALFTAQ